MKRLACILTLVFLLGAVATVISSCGGGSSAAAVPTKGALVVGNETGFSIRVYVNGNAAADLANGVSTSWEMAEGNYSSYACRLTSLTNCTTSQTRTIYAGQTTTITYVAY